MVSVSPNERESESYVLPNEIKLAHNTNSEIFNQFSLLASCDLQIPVDKKQNLLGQFFSWKEIYLRQIVLRTKQKNQNKV